MSGKLNEVAYLFIREIERLSAARRHQWWIEAQSMAQAWLVFHHGLLDGRENELARGAAAAGGGLMKTAMKVARKVDRSTDRIWLHTISVRLRLK